MTEENEKITIKKETLWKYSTFIILALVIIGIFLFFTKDNSSTGRIIADDGSAINGPSGRAEVTADDDAVLGDQNAPVTIIEFSDYQCPFCRKFWTETFTLIKRDYIDTGKARLVFRDFPLSSIHPSAEIASQAAECVKEKGGDSAYWKMHDKMFEEQNILDSGNAKGAVTKTITFTKLDLTKWAKDIGYDISSCLDSGKYNNEIQKDLDDGAAAGVQGTPAFFINGRLLEGAQPYSAFKQAIYSELAK